MRLLILNHEFPPVGGGAANACYHTCREWVRRGADLTVLTTAFTGLPEREVVDGIPVIRVPSSRRQALESSSLELLSFAKTAYHFARRFVEVHRPDLVHAYFGLPSGAVAALLKRKTGLPFTVSFRGRDVHGGKGTDSNGIGQPLRAVSRAVWRSADGLIANSRGLCEIAHRVLPGAQIDIIPNGVDTRRFAPGDPPHDSGPVRLLFVGRLEPYKGLDTLLRAVGILKRDGAPAFELHIVGDGGMRDTLPRSARELGIHDIVRFCGQAPPASMPDIYRSADIFVLPSIVEGMPNGVLEAMASGLPTVGTQIPGTEELVAADTGILVPAGCDRALATALHGFLSDPGRRHSAGAAARRSAETRSWSTVASAHLELFHRILGATEPCVASAAS